MTPLRFYLARTLRDEAALQSLSVGQEALLAALTGKHIALIGNARALARHRFGERIDAADLVVRINRAPMPSAQSHGTRTDWLALATSLRPADRARIAPSRILWMSPKRKRLDHATAQSAGFYLNPTADYAALRDAIGAPPTTGALTIDLLRRGAIGSLTLYGFDFFASQSLSGRRRADQVPHDFGAEAGWVHRLLATDARLRLIETAGSA